MDDSENPHNSHIRIAKYRTMEFRILRYDDLDRDTLYDILALRAEVFVVEQRCAYLDPDGRDKNCYHMICTENGKMKGYLRILPPGEFFKEASIGRVLVTDRRKGIATEIVRRALDFIFKELRQDTVRVEAQTYAVGLYGKFGFETIGEEFMDEGIPHIQMLYKKKS